MVGTIIQVLGLYINRTDWSDRATPTARLAHSGLKWNVAKHVITLAAGSRQISEQDPVLKQYKLPLTANRQSRWVVRVLSFCKDAVDVFFSFIRQGSLPLIGSFSVHCILRYSKFLQTSQIHLSILADFSSAVVWMVLVRIRLSISLCLFSRSLQIVSLAPIYD